MIVEPKNDKTHKDATYKCLAERVLGESVDARALSAKAALFGYAMAQLRHW